MVLFSFFVTKNSENKETTNCERVMVFEKQGKKKQEGRGKGGKTKQNKKHEKMAHGGFEPPMSWSPIP